MYDDLLATYSEGIAHCQNDIATVAAVAMTKAHRIDPTQELAEEAQREQRSLTLVNIWPGIAAAAWF